MTFDALRAYYRARPFRPFVIHTASGDAHTVTHPETIAFATAAGVVIVTGGPGIIAMIDVASITEVTQDFNPKAAISDA